MATVTIKEHIVQTQEVCRGKPRIAGHRIKVQHVAIWHERMGLSADEIVAKHPALTHGDVYAALAYYWDNKDQIDADINEDEAFVADLEAKSGPSLLQQKMAQRNAQDHSLPPG
jgi:uncharacterized protein (DUF433 family)